MSFTRRDLERQADAQHELPCLWARFITSKGLNVFKEMNELLTAPTVYTLALIGLATVGGWIWQWIGG